MLFSYYAGDDIQCEILSLYNRCRSHAKVDLQEEKFKERESIMKAKNSELEESLIRFSKYLQENDAKRARAFKKASDERRLCDEKSTEAEELVSLFSPKQIILCWLVGRVNLVCFAQYSATDVLTQSSSLRRDNLRGEKFGLCSRLCLTAFVKSWLRQGRWWQET
jgi:hypothetical protein